ncbi:LEA type 2 family protein [Methylolobus aquaticus]
MWLLAVLQISGCASWLPDFRHLKEPEVSLTGLALSDPNPLVPRFRVRLRVENPNDIDVSLDGADATLELNGRPVATGVSRSPLTLKRLAESELDLDVAAQTLGMLEAAAAVLAEDQIRYRVQGHLSVLSALGPLGRLPFSFDGAVDPAVLLGQRSPR